MASLNDWVVKVHGLAKERGWWVDKEQELQDTGTISPEAKIAKHMLIVSEVAEATEAVRGNKPPIYVENASFIPIVPSDKNWDWAISVGGKLEGEAIELADVVIRVMDIFGAMGWDLEQAIELKHSFNKTRAFRHGGKAL